MKREFPEIPLVGIGAIIIDGDRVVLVKRAHPPMQAQWSIPGGVLEVGELVREAAVREAREETGLIVEAGALLGVYDRILRTDPRGGGPSGPPGRTDPGGSGPSGPPGRPDPGGSGPSSPPRSTDPTAFESLSPSPSRVQYHYVLIDFLCKPVGGELRADTDASEARWFTRQELPELNLAQDTQDVIRKGFAALASPAHS